MFFIGLAIGVAIYFLILFLAYKGLPIGVCVFISLAGAVVVFAAISVLSGVGYIAAIAVLFLIGYFVGKKKENQQQIVQPKKRYYRYLNHCWNCGNDIDSEHDTLCPKCGKHYICSKCGKCYCDNPLNQIETRTIDTISSTKVMDDVPKTAVKEGHHLLQTSSQAVQKKESVEDLHFTINYSVDYLYDYLFKTKNQFYLSSLNTYNDAVEILNKFDLTINTLKRDYNIYLGSYLDFYKMIQSILILGIANKTEETIKFNHYESDVEAINDLYEKIKNNANGYDIWLH